MTGLPSSLSEAATEVLLADLLDRPILTYDHLPYADFLKNHLIPNTPFLLSAAATSSWSSRLEWTTPTTNASAGPSRANLTALRRYGHHIVPIANTARREYSEFERTERPLSEVLDIWEGKGKHEEAGGEGLYVKDWHLLEEVERAGGGAGEVYGVPECFREDWLNPAYTPNPRSPDLATPGADPPPAPTASQSDFRFTYLGPAGTFTPLHRDVYASYSWSANIVGRKIWWLFPPDPEVWRKLGIPALGASGNDSGMEKMAFDVRDLEGDVGGIKILQEEGEVVFVPSGWYHQVVNLDFCISINHNFIAPATLSKAYDALEHAQMAVEEGIADVKDMIRSRLGDRGEFDVGGVPEWEKEWVEEVQKLLEMDAGWGWRGFWLCVRTNIKVCPLFFDFGRADSKSPPAAPSCSTPTGLRNRYVMQVVEQYRARREWVVLPEVRAIVLEIEDLLFP